jgi:uncharacterized protein (DUF885 family)
MIRRLALYALAMTTIACNPGPGGSASSDPSSLADVASDYYKWRDSAYPVAASDQGLHTGDQRVTDYSMDAVKKRRAHVEEILARVKAMDTSAWTGAQRIDWRLFVSQLEGPAFFARVTAPEESDPQIYVNEVANAVFSLLKKEYAPARSRAMSAAARLEQVPALLEEARKNLSRPVKLYAKLAVDAARGGDDLYRTSLMTIADDLSQQERLRLVNARDAAVKALHDFADWLEDRMPSMPEWSPMGTDNYNYLLKHVLLLPIDAAQVEMLGQSELARYRGLEAMLRDPRLASPDPARSRNVPRSQAEFLSAYQARQKELTDFVRSRKLATIPAYMGPFIIRQLPEAFKPTSPGGFMNPPGLHDADSSGFYFIPTYNPKSENFYIRAAIEDPRPILGHEGIPGHFLQLSIANHVDNEIRRQHFDNTFIEGWALYCEEMLMRQGLYPADSPAHGQVLRLSRYRAARIGVDVNLHTGRWTFDEAVRYFMEAGGLDRESAEGEAAGAAAMPSQKIGYMVGKWQIMRLLGLYRDAHPADFSLGMFHDQLISYGSLPVSVIEELMIGLEGN